MYLLFVSLSLLPGFQTPKYADKQNLLIVANATGKLEPISTSQQWQTRRGHILQAMQQVMGPWAGLNNRAAMRSERIERVETTYYVQEKWKLEVEPNDWLPCYLLLPKKVTRPTPAMLCLHQTNKPLGKKSVVGLGDKPDQHYAKELASQGYICLCPDYPNMGEYKCNPYDMKYQSTTMKAIYNHSRCVDFLLTREEVDAKRIGVIGHSLGGHNAIFLAAFDERLRCVISSCGFCSFARYMKGDLTGWSHDGYMPIIRTEFDRNPAKVPFEFTEVLASLAPRPFFTCSPTGDSNFDVTGVKDCVAAALPVYKLWDAEKKLVAEYPQAGHEFHEETRKKAYRFLQEVMK